MTFKIIKSVSLRGITLCIIVIESKSKPTYYTTFFKGDAEQFEKDLNEMYLVINPKYGIKKGETAIKTTTLGNAEKRLKLLIEGCQNPNMRFV